MGEIDKSNYPGNSYREKREAIDGPRTKAIVKGTIQKRKRSLSESFAEMVYSEETKSVGQYILYDVLIPALKDMITNMVSSGIEMLVYGSSNHNNRLRRDAGRTVVSYNSFSKRDRKDTRDDYRIRSRHRFDEVLIETREDAEEVLSNLLELVDRYNVATVADFYDLVGIGSEWTDNKYGWDNLSSAQVQRVRNGYILNLPRPSLID